MICVAYCHQQNGGARFVHPYKMVKDHRTEIESSNPDEVLDGNLDKFIEAELRLASPKGGLK